MEIKKVLVTGGAGYVGSHVVCHLLENNYEVLVFDNLSTGSAASITKGARLHEQDIRNFDAVKKSISSFRPDAIIHLAALKSATQSLQMGIDYSDTNIVGTINLLKAAISHNVHYFVFSSSAAVYGEPHYLPIDEHHIKEPINYYGETKQAVERMLYWYSKSFPFAYSSLRYFNAAGHEPDAKFLAIERNSENLIPIVMETALGFRDKLYIYGNDYDTQDGTCVRDYVHVSDLAVAHVLSLLYLEKKNSSLELNLGTSRGFSTKEVYDTAVRVTQRNIAMEFAERRAGDPESLYAKSVLAHKLLSWRPTYKNLDEIILHSWLAYQRYVQTSK